MRGTVERYGKGWRYRVERTRDPDTGRRRFATKAGFGSERDARRELNRLLVELDDGTHVGRSDLTLAEYLAGWIETASRDLRPTTTRGYRRSVQILTEQIGGLNLQELTPLRIEKGYARMCDAGRARKTVRNAHGVLHRALADADRLGLVSRNAASSARPPSELKVERPVWTPEELGSFLRSSAGLDLHPAFLLLATTGLRRGEVCGLRWRNVDLGASELFIVETRTTVGRDVVQGPTKTPKSRRRLSLDPMTVSVMQSHRASQARQLLALGGEGRDSDHVFREVSGEPVHPDRVTRAFRRAVEQAGLPRIRLHDLRHTYATLGLRAGIHPKVMSERLGHATVGVTLDLYSHVTPSLDRDAADAVASLIDYQPGPSDDVEVG